ncbi:DNA polymerase III subunit delta' C-terminal domain-containing protein [Buchnera aphidicola (Mindarus keteleerifoliae)]|uniref:DNA polymerase III subunit delta' C-terminal domain-containing protein n=1 Tax=Buchnera aphidicola TaxID=9 RepID=UPI0031B70ECD
MNKYPWLTHTYKKIIHQYTINKLHHTILINSVKGIGIPYLIRLIGYWLLCMNKKDYKNCKKCNGCNLTKSLNHPDWYFLTPEKEKKSINIEKLRKLSKRVVMSPQQGKIKIICFLNTAFLNDYTINTLLKIFEEPPKNTFFLLVSYNLIELPLTLKSRCFLLNIKSPSKKKCLIWFRKNNFIIDEKKFLIALNISENAPLTAIKLIKSQLWEERNNFYEKFIYFLQKKKLILFLPYLTGKNALFKINWIYSILLDSIKYKNNMSKTISNLDKKDFINLISSKYSYRTLDKSLRLWLKCKFYLLNVSNINQELLFAKKLLNWELFLNKKF